MAVTFRTMINRVLRAVSEDEIDDTVDELQDDYHKLVATFVNLIREEIESATNWRSLQQTLSVTLSANSQSATITGANERSRIVRIQDARNARLVPLVFDVTDINNPYQLQEISLPEMKFRQTMYIVTAYNNPPTYFSIDDSSGDDMSILVHPRPAQERSLEVTMVVPQERIADDELDTVIKIPTLPLEFGSIWYALEERGEELGQSNIFTEDRYRNALDAAISRDVDEQGGLELVPV